MMPTTQHVHAQSRTHSLPRDSPPLKTRKKTSVSPPFSPISSLMPTTAASAPTTTADSDDDDEDYAAWRANNTKKNNSKRSTLGRSIDDGGETDFLSQMLANTILGYCQNHDLKSIQLLLGQYPYINLEHQDWRGMTPWLVCSYMGFNSGIRFFAEKGVNTNATDLSGNTALLIAIEKGHVSTVQLLLSLGVVDVSVTNGNGHNSISIAVQFLKSDKLDAMLQILFSEGIDLNQIDQDGESPLMLAMRTRNHLAVKSLLARNAGFAPEDLDESDIFQQVHQYCVAYAKSQCQITCADLLEGFEKHFSSVNEKA